MTVRSARERGVVCDASAVIAFLRGEEGADRVRETLEGFDEGPGGGDVWISTVNLSEVHQEIGERLPEIIGAESIIRPADFTAAHAKEAAALRGISHAAGLGIADRACLALAKTMKLPALTADRVWAGVEAGVEVRVIR